MAFLLYRNMEQILLCFLFLVTLHASHADFMKKIIAQIESPEQVGLGEIGRIKRSENTNLDGMITELKERLKKLERRSGDAGEEPLHRNRRSGGSSCNCKDSVEDVLLNDGGSIDMTECFTEYDGSDYRGRISQTQGGLSCQNWVEQSPHPHNFTDEDDGIGNHSYCRNPDGSSQPWCFTTDISIRREACDVGQPDRSCVPRALTWTGVTYTRYGRSVCPVLNELVYEGFVGGSLSIDEGGGVDFLCMPHTPIYAKVSAGVQEGRAYVYHTEYKDVLPGGLNNHDVPCAVCRALKHSSIIMIPARNVCPDDSWTLQYNGYLGAQRVQIRRHSSEFICLDRQSTRIPGSNRVVEGAQVYNVEGRCSPGSAMPCNGPYQDGNELTCAVCTK